MHAAGRKDEDEGDDAATGANGRGPQHDAELAKARDFVRDVVGRIALDLATTAEGRAAGLSVDVWPTRGVSLRVRTGHELRLLVELHDDVVRVMWERLDPSPRGGRPRASRGSLGKASDVGDEDVRTYLWRWLARRVRG